ncbi:MAG: glycosyltransferase family 39 protein [Anaerolineales bacterium]|nr:glycosyltransferase family 39 protein [Anaerolineales bacterium]
MESEDKHPDNGEKNRPEKPDELSKLGYVHISVDLPEEDALKLSIERVPQPQSQQTGEAGQVHYEASIKAEGTKEPTKIELGPSGTWRGDPMDRLTVQSIYVPPPPKSRTLSLDYSTALRKLTDSISRLFRPKAIQFSIDKVSLETSLFILSLLVYALTRLIALEDFPIYFFTDEAIQTNLAADFIRDGFRNADGTLFPTYFMNVYEYNLNLSVYLQIIPMLIFGKSIFVTRATASLFTLLAPISLGLILKRTFKIQTAWLGILFLSITPAWFLHSRTAFETSVMVSVYACFLFFYLNYRVRSPRFLYPALIFAALTFYSYGPGQIIIAMTGILLLIVDARYHWQNRKTIIPGILLLLLLSLPYLRFQLEMPGKHQEFLRIMNSHWLEDMPLAEKLAISARYYKKGLSIAYWFIPNGTDLPRHLMDDYGHMWLATLPLLLAGLIVSLRKIRQAEYRVLLTAALAIPMGGIVVGVGITRLLSMTIPIAIVTALGTSALMLLISRKIPAHFISIGVFTILATCNVTILRQAVTYGPTWEQDYTIGGMQYGAKQVFSAISRHLQSHPEDRVFLTSTWANGADVLKYFLMPEEFRVQIGNATGFLEMRRELDQNMVFVLSEREVQELRASEIIGEISIIEIVPYPDGSPGFIFLRMSYSPIADTIFAALEAERQRPRTGLVTIAGQQVEVEHPYLDSGGLYHIFDQDTFTLARVFDANPAVFRLIFSEPIDLTGIRATTGSMDFILTISLKPVGEEDPLTFNQEFRGLPDDPTVEISFGRKYNNIEQVVIEIESLSLGAPTKIHVRELELY